MDKRRFWRRLDGRGILLDCLLPRNGQSAVTGGGGIDDGRGHGVVMAYGWKGSTAYCEAPPCTHVGSAGVWAAGASLWTAPGLGMAPPPSLGAEESTTGGGRGFVAACRWKGATDYCEALPCTHVSWRLGGRGILQDGPWLRNGHSAVAGGGGIDDGGHGISSLCLGETGRGLVCGPSMDPRRFSWRLVGRGIFLDVRRHWWRRNQVQCGGGGGGGVSSRRTGGKGPRSTVRPHHGPTSVLAAIGRQGHPSGLPLPSEWPVRRHWGRGIDDGRGAWRGHGVRVERVHGLL